MPECAKTGSPRTLSALADPTRRAILARLANGEATVGELAAPFAMSLPAVSRHLKVLERAGLIARGREAQWRPCRLDAGAARARWRAGSRATAASGRRASTASTPISPTCRKEIPMDAITDAARSAATDPAHRAPAGGAARAGVRRLDRAAAPAALERAARLRDPGVATASCGPAAAGTRRCARRTARSCGSSAPTARSCRRSGWSSPTPGSTTTGGRARRRW